MHGNGLRGWLYITFISTLTDWAAFYQMSSIVTVVIFYTNFVL